MSEAKRHLQDILKLEGNEKCADCGAPDPDWASYNIGVFICENCAGLHRHLGSHISKVKSVKLDNWDSELVDMMELKGNKNIKESYECDVPTCYRRPKPDDPQVLREQWIRAKYDRSEFANVEKQIYLKGHMEGYLWKRGKDDKKFNKRKFVLSESENVLKYYVKDDAKEPKASLRIDDITVALVPEKIGHPNAMQIMFEQDGGTRNLFVFSDDGKDMVNWYTAIRSVKLNRLRIAYPGTPDEELIPLLTRDFLKEGWLSKTGPNKGDAYRRRWFTLDKRKLMYYEDSTDAFPKGEIFIGTEDKNFKVKDGVPPEIKDPGNTFTLRAPHRYYYFSAETDEDKRQWMAILRKVIATPLSPQDTSNLARYQLRS